MTNYDEDTIRRAAEQAAEDVEAEEAAPWAEPDMGILNLRRRPAPAFPVELLGDYWQNWCIEQAKAAACPVDYVVAPLLATVSVLIGNARWPQAAPGWSEPPHLWIGAVGDPGDGKSPGADPFTKQIIPQLEQVMIGDFPEQLKAWRALRQTDRVNKKYWERKFNKAKDANHEPPPPPVEEAGPEPQPQRLMTTDATVEWVGKMLSSGSPKGLLVLRDELSGWILGMNQYNESGRSFWLEGYGGRRYAADRLSRMADIPHHVVSVYGGVQPDKLADLMDRPDDGLLGRILWFWPEPVRFELRREALARIIHEGGQLMA